MEPLPETRTALEELGLAGPDDLLPALLENAALVRQVVPSCVGLSLALLHDGVTFTLVATSSEIAALDAVQYLDGGPCVEGGKAGDVVAFPRDDVLGEDRWSAFARATAAAGVATTLTLPVVDAGGAPVGSVNLYAAEPGAFDGHHEALAAILDAWAPGAVVDADLAFRTRDVARAAPAVLEERAAVDRAVGALVSARGISVTEARAVIRDVAERSGTSEPAVARLVLETLLEGPEGGHREVD